ncbi:hypothetical protein A9Q78_06020 [Methylophaga sp. 41_12_T18]|nr:hypothetical protein A9Q78_06020 [Methylophaga sp. 41_12_T18]
MIVGSVSFGIPEKEVKFLQVTMNLDVFVEGGTYQGGTAAVMSNIFSKVYTIENSEVMYEKAKEKLKQYSNVSMLKGDTRAHLHGILENNDNILFWLDAHWSGGDTYGKSDECPLIKELEIIFNYEKNCVILIDDARLFLAPPPLPHDYKEWPSLSDITKVIPADWDLVEYEDVIYLYSKNIESKFKSFLQQSITSAWREQSKSNILNDVKSSLKKLLSVRNLA